MSRKNLSGSIYNAIKYYFIILQIFYCVLKMSMMTYAESSILSGLSSMITITRLLFLIITVVNIIFYDRVISKNNFIILFILAIMCVYGYATKSSYLFFDAFFIAIVLYRDNNYETIVNVFYWSLISSFLLVIFLNSSNMLPVYHFYRTGSSVERLTLGFSHPNTLGQILLTISCLHVLKRADKLNTFDLFFITALGYFSYIVPNSVSSAVAIFLIAITLIIKKIYEKFTNRTFFRNKTRKILLIVFPLAILLLVMVVTLGGVGESLIKSLSSTLYSRFYWGAVGIKTYGIHLFGQSISFSGTYDMITKSNASYFVIDCFYIYMLLVWGLIGAVYYLVMFMITIQNAYKNKRGYLLLIILVLLIYSISETFFIYYISFFVFICAFASQNNKGEKI